ncbi:MAG: hypothetical protein COU31_01040 [Candidatus Magasanikbacteria bacterium CG10_big_fil_rev_8_21_14_0_10_40_10]|uniref:N-end rule aminoacyl transferase C-terminal domain-containing protein n=1 Tax=Candidatus Magasanikbacteria bacterium CG10_big_fil_rev_8_21_14_0_10_40_10 TaxID=1974648 RepID=A0A2M6W4S3_9BACT|nr:MAG: hypothetical protein COU31_01040 [Candidatus Magasanikbacteria bacterium CG10_big_fil_rev_8_21_14_0_10_40_10]
MYLKWQTQTITDFSDENIQAQYDKGYLFGRTKRGEMYQTRSARIDLNEFILSSENKRILRKTENIQMRDFPLPYVNYNWTIHKLGHDFYSAKFGDKTFSANKIKEIMTDADKSNFNLVFVYNNEMNDITTAGVNTNNNAPTNERAVGYCIACQTDQILHYCYPFYDLKNSPDNMGLGMMTRAVIWAQENNKQYVYLGSFSRPSDTYKLQFKGLQWFDGENWQTDLEKLKKNIQS